MSGSVINVVTKNFDSELDEIVVSFDHEMTRRRGGASGEMDATYAVSRDRVGEGGSWMGRQAMEDVDRPWSLGALVLLSCHMPGGVSSGLCSSQG